jgi:hypothetical protein
LKKEKKMNNKKVLLVGFLLVIFSMVLINCSGGFKDGDIVLVRKDATLRDYNASFVEKPIMCKVTKGQKLVVTGSEFYSQGGGAEQLEIVWVVDPNDSFCWGGAPATFFKSVK